jgi:hypothetical protein
LTYKQNFRKQKTVKIYLVSTSIRVYPKTR